MSKHQSCKGCNSDFVGPDTRIGENFCSACKDEMRYAFGCECPELREQLASMTERAEKAEANEADWCAEVITNTGHFVRDGEMRDWFDSCAMSVVCDAGDRLVELGLWEFHPKGYDRRWFYRPLTKQHTDGRKDAGDGGRAGEELPHVQKPRPPAESQEQP